MNVWQPGLEARVRQLLLEAAEDLVKNIIDIDVKLTANNGDDVDEVEKIVLAAYREVLLEELISVINYLEAHEKPAEAAVQAQEASAEA